MSKQNTGTDGASVVAAIFGIAVIIPSALVSGWAISANWDWFVVPLFHLPPLSIWPAVGLDLTASCFLFRSRLRSLTNDELVFGVLDAFGTNLMFLVMGRILAGFLGLA